MSSLSSEVKYAELFAGVGGFRDGIEQAGNGFRCVYANELDKYASAVYRHIWRGNRELIEGDIRDQKTSDIPDIHFLTAGFPCQSFSLAGKRLGLSDTRGTLFFEVARVLADKRPRHFLLENVKGLVGHDGGKTIQTMFRILADLGYRIEWQVLNSTCWVPQNRERIFIIGHLRGECGRKVFPLREDDGVLGKDGGEMLPSLTSSDWRGPSKQRAGIIVIQKTAGETVTVKNNETGCLQAGGMNVRDKVPNVLDISTPPVTTEMAHGTGFNQTPGVARAIATATGCSRFRRLTPVECERLQGWKDNHTALGLYLTAKLPKSKRGRDKYTLQPISDTQRYKMTGNGVTADVVREVVLKMMAVGCFE